MHVLDEFESKRLLKEWGLPVINEVLVDKETDALKAAEAFTYPVALKVCSRDVLHKTERGGVALGIPDAASLKAAVRAMRARFTGIPHQLLVQRMAPSGVELILGARRDPVFGPVVMAGMGGVFTEVFRDTAIELAPLTLRQALGMLRRLKGQTLLQGYRGQNPVDLMTMAEALVGLGRFVAGRPDILEIDINPLIVYPQGAVAVDALIRFMDHAAPIAPRRQAVGTVVPFFHPRSIALIGASRSHGKGGNIILRNLMRAGYQGALYPINPSGHDILGMQSFKRVSDVPGPVDLAMIVIPKTAVPDALADCAAKGVPAVILSTGGYADIGEAGTREQASILSLARTSGMRIMGPNSIGTIHPRLGLATSIVGLEPIASGGVSLIGQSGVFSSGWGRWIADAKPFGLSKVACIGNKGDINESDLLEYLAQDPETKTIGMYLEGVVEGGRFIRAAAKACRAKPVVVVKSGHTAAGAEAIASHTGSLAGSDAVFDAVCRRTGLVRAHDSEAFFDTLSAFESLPLPKGNRLGVLSITGMGCVVTTDACDEYGVALPALRPPTLKKLRTIMPAWAPVRNPIDIWSAVEQHGSLATMRHITRCLLEQGDIDAVLMIFVLMPESIFNIREAFGDILRAFPKKPVFVASYGGTQKEIAQVHEGFRELGVPTYPTPERAIYAFSRMAAYARFRARK